MNITSNAPELIQKGRVEDLQDEMFLHRKTHGMVTPVEVPPQRWLDKLCLLEYQHENALSDNNV